MTVIFPTNSFFFFFNDTATTEIYTLSLHDALPICDGVRPPLRPPRDQPRRGRAPRPRLQDRKSTRLNSSHLVISYAVFCLKKKNSNQYADRTHQNPSRCTTTIEVPAASLGRAYLPR